MEMVFDAGMWAGMTLYPETKCTPGRGRWTMLETYGHERLWHLNSACDWGVSDPLAVPKTALEMKRRGHFAALIEKVIFPEPETISVAVAPFLASINLRFTRDGPSGVAFQ